MQWVIQRHFENGNAGCEERIEQIAMELFGRTCCSFYFILPCLLFVFCSTVYASSNPAPEEEHCKIINILNDIRPNADGEPVKVTVGVRMLDLMEINDVNQTLTADFGVAVSWVDPRLSRLEGCEVPLDKIWSPGLLFFNSGRKFATLPEKANIGPDGQVKYFQRYSGTFATYHNLNEFPFDKQTFRISLFPFEWTEKDVELVVDRKLTGRYPRLNISDWNVKEVEASIGRNYSLAFEAYVYSYDFDISAQRIKAFYVWKVLLPLCLIVAMSWSVFWISPAQFGPQIGLSATSMLTMIAFIFTTTNMVPRLGYLTLLDRFIVGSTILVFLALLESLTTVYLVSNEKEELAIRMDKFSRLLFPLAFAVLSATVLIF